MFLVAFFRTAFSKLKSGFEQSKQAAAGCKDLGGELKGRFSTVFAPNERTELLIGLIVSAMISLSTVLVTYKVKPASFNIIVSIIIPYFLVLACLMFIGRLFGIPNRFTYGFEILIALGLCVQLIIVTGNKATSENYATAISILIFSALGIIFGLAMCVFLKFLLALPKRSVVLGLTVLSGILYFLLLAFGDAVGNTKAWLSVGGVSIQLTEVIKIFGILQLAAALTDDTAKNTQRLINSMLVILFHGVFLFAVDELSALLILAIVWLMLGFVFYPRIRHILLTVLIFAVLALLVVGACYIIYRIVADGEGNIPVGTAAPLRIPAGIYDKIVSRIRALIDPSAEDQSKLIYNALVSSKWWGCNHSLATVPALSQDLSFLVVITKIGIIPALMTLLLMSTVTFDGMLLSLKSKEPNNGYAFGLMCCISATYLITVASSSLLFPIVGIVAPFLGSGGSAMLTSFGLLISIMFLSRQPILSEN